MAEIKKSQLPEVGVINDNDYFDILATDGKNKRLKFSIIKDAVSGGSVDYIDIVGKGNVEYRVTLNKDGELVIYKKEAYTAELPQPSESGRFKGLIINQMYGGGSNTNNTACSHHFIELYNNNTSGAEMNLRGLYLSVKGKTGNWQSIALEGIIPYQHSFLIRCNQVSSFVLLRTRMKIDYYDMEWDIDIPDIGFSAYLSVGEPSNAYPNPFNSDGSLNKAVGYIDLIGAGGTEEINSVVAYENRYPQMLNKDIGIRRLDFADTDNNQKDCRAVNWSTCNTKLYRPRCLKDGAWDLYFDKAKLKETIPNLVNICYGKDGETTRTFTWESVVTDEGWIKYRKLDESEWIMKDTTRELVTHYDTDATIHRVIIHDLEPGIYEYQCGEEGSWGDIATFEVKLYQQNANPSNHIDNHMKILWTSDQQGFTKEEYDGWKVSYKNIREWEEWDWALNTGDISQNANRSFEWRYYFKYALESTRNGCHMLTCGNNDLIDKKYSDAFTYYMTPEYNDDDEQKYNSCHSFDLGFVHFVCLNSNQDYSMFDYDGGETVDTWIQRECAWLDADLTRDAANSKTRWVICYMHLSPFTVVRSNWVQRFIPIFEKHRVHLVLCG